MENVKSLKSKFDSLNGAKFININGYIAKGSGEVANHNVNVNISVENAKQDDLDMLRELSDADIMVFANKVGATMEEALEAVRGEKGLIASAEKNLSKDKEKRSAQSKGQSEAYAWLGKGLRLHLDTMEVHLFAFRNSKKILVEGVYPEKKPVKSSKVTLVKNAIRKTFKMAKSRDFILGHVDSISVTGDTIQLK